MYRKPFVQPGESRRPTLTWPRQIPLEGEPADVRRDRGEVFGVAREEPLPKLFVNAEPGAILTGAQREYCRKWPNQREVTVKGVHFIQEDSPHEIGARSPSGTSRSERNRRRATHGNYSTLLFEVRDHVAHITLNRPEAANGVNLEMASKLRHAARRGATDPMFVRSC